MPAKRFGTVATGGTFDEIHAGHMALLGRAFEVADRVIIGVTSDGFAAKTGKKNLNHNYEKRVENLKAAIKEKFGSANFIIARLDTDFGPASVSAEVQALVASTETASKEQLLNKLRAEKGLKPVTTVVVEMVRAQDGKRISSTRIRAGEIDSEGKLKSR